MLHVAVVNICCEIHEELLNPSESHMDFTCQRYEVDELKEVIVIEFVLTVSMVHPPVDL